MTIDHPMIGCIERAVGFIQTELQEDRAPSLDAIATASGMSKFHFHRIFKLVTGETCGDAIARLRLARGTSLMQTPGVSITEAALAAGTLLARPLQRPSSEPFPQAHHRFGLIPTVSPKRFVNYWNLIRLPQR